MRRYAVAVPAPAQATSEATRVLAAFLRDVTRENADRFRIFGSGATASNRLGAVFEATDRQWEGERLETAEHLAATSRSGTLPAASSNAIGMPSDAHSKYSRKPQK